MRIAVLGTGMVGQAHAARLQQLGHDVTVGTRDVSRTLARDETRGTTGSFAQWQDAHPGVAVDTFSAAVANADLVVCALQGGVAVDVLTGLADDLAGRALLDIANPLDFSHGQPELFVCNTDSLGERIQRALPETGVVKTLCTVTADVQVDPARFGAGEHDMFVAGNASDAKATATQLLRDYGWHTVRDLGGIDASRGMEMMMLMWLRLMNHLGTPYFNYRVVT